jgi:hypothetical protein
MPSRFPGGGAALVAALMLTLLAPVEAAPQTGEAVRGPMRNRRPRACEKRRVQARRSGS